MTGLLKERINFVSELWDQGFYFFQAPDSYNPKDVKKRWKPHIPDTIKEVKDILSNTEPFNEENTEQAVKKYIEENELGMGQVLNALRITIVGAARGPHLFTIIDMIGKEETLKRIQTGLDNIKRE